jgi:glucose/arabinose dehydrogenase
MTGCKIRSPEAGTSELRRRRRARFGGRLAPHRTHLFALVLAAVAGLVSGCDSRSEAQGSLPAGFVDELVATVELPTDLAFTPDGRLLVTTQAGVLRVIEKGRLLRRPALDLRTQVCRDRERGLVGVTVDPHFSTNHLVYVYYTFKKFGSCPTRSDEAPVNRTVRYRLRQDNTLDPGSEQVIIDNVPSFHGTHNGGDLEFGKDGYLYISVGDGGRDYARRTTRSFTNVAARDRNVLLGKIVRVTSSGRPAPGNPFAGPGSVRCATTGPVEPGWACREIFAWGLRNPFRMAFDPNARETRFFINDVGEVTWEEVNRGVRGADYGWNLREGPCPVHGRARCGPAPPWMTEPVLSYAHRTGCASITGGAFVPDGIWPRKYDGGYLFADFICGKIFFLGAAGNSAMSEFAVGLPVLSVTSMAFGSLRGGAALYYTSFAGGGEVRRIAYRPTGSPGK